MATVKLRNDQSSTCGNAINEVAGAGLSSKTGFHAARGDDRPRRLSAVPDSTDSGPAVVALVGRLGECLDRLPGDVSILAPGRLPLRRSPRELLLGSHPAPHPPDTARRFPAVSPCASPAVRRAGSYGIAPDAGDRCMDPGHDRAPALCPLGVIAAPEHLV